jgi:hypothetical protein
MKGIYLTEQGKQEIEAKIIELEIGQRLNSNPFSSSSYWSEITLYKKILESATILPVEKNWVDLDNKAFEEDFKSHQHLYNSRKYPNGVVIQPKQ